MFRVTIEELAPERTDVDAVVERPIKRFEQTVDTLDIGRIVALMNTKPRTRRTTKAKAAA